MTTERSTGFARRRLAVAVAFALGGLNLSTWGPRLPTIKHDLGAGDGTLGLLIAGMTVASLLGLVASSAVLGRLGPRWAVTAMLSLTGVGVIVVGAASGLAHSVPLTEVGLVLMGFGIGTSDVIINVEGAEVERQAGTVLMPFLHACWSAGAVVGAGIGAGAAALGTAPVQQFLIEGLLTVAVIVVVGRGLPELDRAAGDEASAPLGQRVVGWLRGWTDVRLLLIGVVMLGAELGEGSANGWLTLGVAQGHGQRDWVAALYFTAFAASETLTRALSGPVIARIGRVRAVRITAAVGAVGVAVFVLGGPPWLVLIGTVMWAIGVSMGFPLGMSSAAESGPNPAARVSVVASVGYVANLAGPPVVGFLSQAVGLLNALWLLVVFLMIALAAAGSFAPRMRRAELPQG